MGPRPHLWFFCIQNSVFNTRIASLYGSQHCKTSLHASLTPELQVSMGPSPHLRFLHAKQRYLDQNYKSPWVSALICGFCMQNCDFRIRITSLYGPQTSPFYFAFKTATLAPDLQVSIVPSPHLQNSDFGLCIHNGDIMARINSLYGSQTSPVVLCLQNMVISTRITSLHGSQTSPVVLCLQNNLISIRKSSLYGSQSSPVVFAFKTEKFGWELQVSMGPRPHLWFFACKTATLALELLVSMGPSLHLWLLYAKQRL